MWQENVKISEQILIFYERGTHVDVAVAHVQKMQRVLFVSSSPWHGSAARKLQVHVHCKVNRKLIYGVYVITVFII